MEPTARTIQVHGLRARYFITGEENRRHDAPTVVLLHGGGCDSAQLSWEPFMAALGPHFRVLAPDFPGYGESEQQPAAQRPDGSSAYGIAANVEFLSGFLDALSVRRASLAGISMGGGVALGFALRSPEQVEKLVLVDSYGLQPSAPFHKLSWLFVHTPGINAAAWGLMRSRAMVRYSLQYLLARRAALTPALLELAFQEANRPGAGVAWNAFQRDEMTWRGARTCFMERLGEIQAPTLIIHGEKDGLVPPECSREAQRRIPGARLHWMEGCGHWPQRDDPQTFNQVVKNFLLEEAQA